MADVSAFAMTGEAHPSVHPVPHPLDEADLADKETDVVPLVSASDGPHLIVYEARQRIAVAFRQLAAHFDALFHDDRSYVNFPRDLVTQVNALLAGEEYAEAHRVLGEIVEECGAQAFDRKFGTLYSEVLRLLTAPKSDVALHAALRDKHQQTVSWLRVSMRVFVCFPVDDSIASRASRYFPVTLVGTYCIARSAHPHADTHRSIQLDRSSTDHEEPSSANSTTMHLSTTPDTPNSQLKSWKRRASACAPASLDIQKSHTVVPHQIGTLNRSQPGSPVHSLWIAKTMGMADSGDPYLAEASAAPAEDLVTWKLFERIRTNPDLKLDHDVYLAFAQRLGEHYELDKGIIVAQSLPQKEWTLAIYKLLIFLHLSKRPKDVHSAQMLLQQYAGSQTSITVKNEDGTTATRTGQPTAAERHVLWFYFTSLVKEAKWSDCTERYVEAKSNTEGQGNAHLDNAIMAVALTYLQYEYGWGVYEQMREMDRNSPAIVMSLCWKAFFARNPETKERIHTRDELMMWEARAWAIYGRVQRFPESIRRGSEFYVANRLRDIIKHSPDEDSREAKLAQLHGEQQQQSPTIGFASTAVAISPRK